MNTAAFCLTCSASCSTTEREPADQDRVRGSTTRLRSSTDDLSGGCQPVGPVPHPLRSWMIMVQVETEAKPIVNRDAGPGTGSAR